MEDSVLGWCASLACMFVIVLIIILAGVKRD